MHSALALLALLGLSVPSSAQTTADVIIVGSGMAGLNAARTLTKAGKSVIVLEARDRTGGRVWTDKKTFGFPVDLGASWIHGSNPKNPITKEATAGDFATALTDWDSDTMYYSNGDEASATDSDKAETLYEQALAYSKTVESSRKKKGLPDVALSTAFDEFIKTKKITGKDLTLLKWAIDSNIQHEYGADTSALSLYNWDSDEEYEGEEVVFKDGYEQIPNKILKEANATGKLKVFLSHIVKKVDYATADKAVVTCSNGKSFTGKRVIVTVPLGVLKNPTASTGITFTPALPKDTTNAINALGMGLLNKIYVAFPTSFWDNTDVFSLVSSTVGQFTEGVNLKKVLGKNGLLFFQAGAYGIAGEAKTDDQLVGELMTILRNIYGDKIPNPSAKLVTRWSRDPYTLGSYSYLKVGASPKHRAALANGVSSTLWFAGEACNTDYPSTITGAFVSGGDAAAEVLDSF
eukprot:comp11669_c0_seq1/m.6190 comp11669_c0_seq1/g.6190  ORF comp11669_c0_seq1/g.6190 comp11669_c0_seq1/m.6190 type:complete len:463 (-) comp11669_c0_seq1:283-1671(-)